MKVQPPVEVFIPGQGFALIGNSTGMWTHFSEFGQAQHVLALVKTICPNAVVQDGTARMASGQGFIYLDNVTRLWEITGTIETGDHPIAIDELAGDLFDAISSPRPFIDRNPDTSLGGPNLKVTEVAQGVGQLSWSK